MVEYWQERWRQERRRLNPYVILVLTSVRYLGGAWLLVRCSKHETPWWKISKQAKTLPLRNVH